MRQYLRIGLITRPHGIHGAVKLTPLTDDPARFRGLREAYIERGDGSYEPVAVSEVGIQPDLVHLTLSCSTTREEAESLRNAYLCVDREHAVKLPQGSYFVADLIGCKVSDSAGNHWGTLVDVLETGSADVYVVKGERTLMLPALKSVLVKVDVEEGRIILDADVLKEVGLFED